MTDASLNAETPDLPLLEDRLGYRFRAHWLE